MATNNNDARKKQKKTVALDDDGDGDGDGDDSLSLSPPVVVVPALSVGNMLKEFPDFLFCLLPYVGDRVIWNSIASSNKDMHAKAKAIPPPWPLCYKLPFVNGGLWSWSPCGTRLACSVNSTNIVIFDQRYGPLGNNGHINAHDGSRITNLKYSPDGSFLVSTGSDSFVRLWDTVTGNNEQLQEWNMRDEVANGLFNNIFNVCVSTCSKYIAVSLSNCVFLKDVEDRGKTISCIAQNENMLLINNIMFSSNDCAIFSCVDRQNGGLFRIIKVWHPYLDDDDENRLITIWRDTDSNRGLIETITFSNDITMVAIHNPNQDKGILWSIDMEHKCLTYKSDFLVGNTGFCFTADNKYIVCNTNCGPTFRSIAEDECKDHSILYLSRGNNTNHGVKVQSVSPNNQQLVVEDSRSLNLYITSYSIL